LSGNSRNGWTKLVLAVAIAVYLIYFAAAAYTFENLPPIPDKVETFDGELLFTGKDIVDGKHLVQRYGLQDYGSILGFGGYFGVDYTAYSLKFIKDNINTSRDNLVTIVDDNGETVFKVDQGIAAAYNDLQLLQESMD
jgi:nitric oxide reductase subunit B